MKSYITTTTKLYLHENQYITSADYPQIAKLIEAGSMETYSLEQQTHFRSSLLSLRKIFFGGREATTGNVSAVPRLGDVSLTLELQY